MKCDPATPRLKWEHDCKCSEGQVHFSHSGYDAWVRSAACRCLPAQHVACDISQPARCTDFSFSDPQTDWVMMQRVGVSHSIPGLGMPVLCEYAIAALFAYIPKVCSILHIFPQKLSLSPFPHAGFMRICERGIIKHIFAAYCVLLWSAYFFKIVA